MGVFAPAALGLLSLLGVIVAFYMLRLRREEHRVPSILLWEALAEEPPANAPWQRLRWTPLLILQLLALALLVLALARPWYWGDALSGEHLVLLVDRSASMAATDLSPNRLEVARGTLLEMLDSAGDARVTLVAFDREMEVSTSAEADRAKVEAALAELRPSSSVSDANDALVFADSLARDQDETQIVIFSDGGFDYDPALIPSPPPRFVQIGEADDNQAITALSIEDAVDGQSLEAFVQVANAGRRASSRRIEIWAEGSLVDARDLTLGPGERWSHTLVLPNSVEQIEARLAGTDAFALDDRAWAIRARPASIRVNLISSGNRFLETALGLLPSVGSVRVLDAEADGDLVGRADLSVLDGGLRAGWALPKGGLLIIGPTESMALGTSGSVEVVGRLEAPQPRVVEPENRLTRGLALDQVSVLEAAALDLGIAWTPLVVADVDGRAWPLMAQGEVEGRPALLLAFELLASDLPLRPAFPLMMASALEFLAPISPAGLPVAARPGEPLSFRLPAGAVDPRIMSPDGVSLALEIEGEDAGFTPGPLPGIYQLVFDRFDGQDMPAGDRRNAQASIPFAVNAIATDPIDLRPHNPFASDWTGAEEVEEGSDDAGAQSQAQAQVPPPETKSDRGRREFWWPLVMLVLLLLVLEWAYDHRRTLNDSWQKSVGPSWLGHAGRLDWPLLGRARKRWPGLGLGLGSSAGRASQKHPKR